MLNSLVVYMALGGSTNVTVHLLVMAGRAGITLTLADMDAQSRATPGARGATQHAAPRHVMPFLLHW